MVHIDVTGICAEITDVVLTPTVYDILTDGIKEFNDDYMKIDQERAKLYIDSSRPDWKLKVEADTFDWKVNPVPASLLEKSVDMGDVDPSNGAHMLACVNSKEARGIQIDFDDGCCPTFENVLRGHFNVTSIVHGRSNRCLSAAGPTRFNFGDYTTAESAPVKLADCPLLIVRPRSFCMREERANAPHGINGGLFDFLVHMALNGQALLDAKRGPFVYLPKIETASMAALWAKVFAWTEKRFGWPLGTIRCIVLVEHFLLVGQLPSAAHALRHHLVGLNLGVFDYTASLLNLRAVHLPSDRPLPPRRRLNLQAPYMQAYAHHVHAIASRHGVPLTGGMVAFAPPSQHAVEALEAKAKEGKRWEANLGAMGGLSFDPRLVRAISQAYREGKPGSVTVDPSLVGKFEALPSVEKAEDQYNEKDFEVDVLTLLLFCASWRLGRGTFVLNGVVEDSATAEASRALIVTTVRHSKVFNGLHGRALLTATLRKVVTQACEVLACLPGAKHAVDVGVADAERVVEESIRGCLMYMTEFLQRRVGALKGGLLQQPHARL